MQCYGARGRGPGAGGAGARGQAGPGPGGSSGPHGVVRVTCCWRLALGCLCTEPTVTGRCRGLWCDLLRAIHTLHCLHSCDKLCRSDSIYINQWQVKHFLVVQWFV